MLLFVPTNRKLNVQPMISRLYHRNNNFKNCKKLKSSSLPHCIKIIINNIINNNIVINIIIIIIYNLLLSL